MSAGSQTLVFRKIAYLSVSTIAIFGSLTLSAGAVDVTALTLPRGFTVQPEGEKRLVSIAPDGTVAAVAQAIDRDGRSLAVRWDAAGAPATYSPLPVLTSPSGGRPADRTSDVMPTIAGVVAASGVAYVNVGEPFSGAYSGFSVEAQRWIGGTSRHWDLSRCAAGDNRDQFVNGADSTGRVAVTFERTGAGSFLVMNDTIDSTPYAFVVDATGCHARGRAVILDTHGTWASGCRGYLNGKLAPTNLNTIVERSVAVRWDGAALSELGDGDALAINSGGLAVGATAVPGRFDAETTNFFGNPGRTYGSAVPHAIAWHRNGATVSLDDSSKRSVAYDVADDGTIVGMLQSSNGRHYAFRRHDGHLQRLDDLPHAPGWRFEAAYAIAPDGTIVGTGTKDDVPAVFRWKP